jgi:hypothetical protein
MAEANGDALQQVRKHQEVPAVAEEKAQETNP